MVNLETAWPNGQPWPRRRLGALPRCNWQGFKVTKPSSTSTEMSRRRANRSQSRFYQKNDKLSFIFINHDLSIDLVSLVPAKQFAPVVVLKAGLVRFPMLSPPSDSTYWGHLRKTCPGSAENVQSLWGIFGERFLVRKAFSVSPFMIFHRFTPHDFSREFPRPPRKTAIRSWGKYVPWPVVQILLAAGHGGDLGSYERGRTGTKNQNRRKWQRWLMDTLWIFMDIYGYLWIFMDIYGYYYGNLHVLLLWGLGSWMFLR